LRLISRGTEMDAEAAGCDDEDDEDEV